MRWPEQLLEQLAPLDYPHGIRFLVVHTSASRPEQARNLDIHAVNEMHKLRNFTMVGYHHLITTDGRVQNGRPYNKMGAHVKGHNHESLGICLAGGLDENGKPADTYSGSQKAALVMVLRSLKVLCPQAEILGHRDLSPDTDGNGQVDEWEWVKACPCFDVRAWCDAVGVEWRAK